MAIQTRIINGSYAEIYVGRGNFITQSAPTNFHQFYTRKILTESESIDDFREVTASEKAALEKLDAALPEKEPSPSLVTMWKAAVKTSGANVYMKGGFDENTRTGTLNGISGLTSIEMADILHAGVPENPFDFSGAFAYNPFIRTNLWTQVYTDGTIKGQKVFYKCANLEVACASFLIAQTDTFSFCPKLHTIIGPLYLYESNPAPFRGCASLVNLPASAWNGNLNISDSPLLSLSSVSELVSRGKSGTSLTLHPDAYARVTDEIFALAAEKNITIAST